MDALYVVLAVGVAAALALGSRSWSRRDRSVERYGRALDTLAEVTRRSPERPPAGGGGAEGRRTGAGPAPARAPGHPGGEDLPPSPARAPEGRRLVFDALGEVGEAGEPSEGEGSGALRRPPGPDRAPAAPGRAPSARRLRRGPGLRLGSSPAGRPGALGALVGLALLGALAFLVATLLGGPGSTSRRAAAGRLKPRAPALTGGARAASTPSSGGSASRSTGAPSIPDRGSGRPSPSGRREPTSTTSTTSTTAPPGERPVISALDPASGAPGSSVSISGSRFYSADGRILVTFDGRVTATRCPSEALCVATVPPPPPGSTTASVEVVTQSGQSNSLVYRYR